MERAFLSPIQLTAKQEKIAYKHSNISRILYNATIQSWKNRYFRKKSLNWFVNKFKLTLSETKIKNPTYTDFKEKFAWANDTSSYVRRESVQAANDAFLKFFKGKSKYPRFKSKKSSPPKFLNAQGDSIKLFDMNNSGFATHIKVPGFGLIKLIRKNYLPLSCKIIQAAFSFRAGKWYVSVSMHLPEKIKPLLKVGLSYGVDIGARTIAAVSNGKEYKIKEDVNLSLQKLEKQLKRWQRTMSRRFKKGVDFQSKGFLEAKEKVQILNKKISDIRTDINHKISHNIVNHKPEKIVLEHLNVKGMKSNRRLAPTLQKHSFYRLQQFIAYKAKQTGVKAQQVTTFFPSSQTCSGCGNIKGKGGTKKQGSGKIYNCNVCGLSLDRDINAAINLEKAPLNILKDLS